MCDMQWKYILIFWTLIKLEGSKIKDTFLITFLLKGIKKVIQIIKGEKESKLQNLESCCWTSSLLIVRKERVIKRLNCLLVVCFFGWQPILWWRCTFWSSQRLQDVMFLSVWHWSYRKGYSVRKSKCISLSYFLFLTGIHFSFLNESCLCAYLSCTILCFVCLVTELLSNDGIGSDNPSDIFACVRLL